MTDTWVDLNTDADPTSEAVIRLKGVRNLSQALVRTVSSALITRWLDWARCCGEPRHVNTQSGLGFEERGTGTAGHAANFVAIYQCQLVEHTSGRLVLHAAARAVGSCVETARLIQRSWL